jgi:ATP:ADP antiporter, AAA family
MPRFIPPTAPSHKTWLDRALSICADVRAGEGVTVVLMLVNIFALLVCYSVIKTVREPLILLGGGAEVRSYAAAGQALLLMGFVPLYSWFASRVDRVRLLVGVTLFFIVCVELFAVAVAAHVPYVGVAFFIWVGIFNISLVAQFWSFANDIYSKPVLSELTLRQAQGERVEGPAGDRLFPIIVIGMTAGAPLGSFVSARLFELGAHPQSILQISALLLTASLLLYLTIDRRETRRAAEPPPAMSSAGGFRLVFANPYLRLIAVLIVLLNIVNTTGEYLISRLLTSHVKELALVDPSFNAEAFIGGYIGNYQLWVNLSAFVLQAFVASRLVRYRGLAGVLLALPLIALGGYSIIAAGAGLSIVRWIKTAENATDYSLMNTARQLLWLPTMREEKYKAKQAIDTFFVRGGDVISAAVVYLGTSVMHLTAAEFAGVNVVLTLLWIALAIRILHPQPWFPRLQWRRLAAAAALVPIVLGAKPASAQEPDTREAQAAAERAAKATKLRPYEPTATERRIMLAQSFLQSNKPVYAFIGSVFDGGGLAIGPGYRGRFADTGRFDMHAAWSLRSYKVADAQVALPEFASGRLTIQMNGHWLDAPAVAFYGLGNSSSGERHDYAFRRLSGGATARLRAAPFAAVGGGLDYIAIDATDASPTYRRTRAFAEFDWRTSPTYTRRGGLYRMDWSDYQDVKAGGRNSFRRVDAEVDQFVPLLRENWVLALRAAASTTDAAPGQDVPYFLMPDLGGSHTLRGYSVWRFRDRNRLLMTGEFRWTAGPFVDMALFADAGKVASRVRDLDLQDLKRSYGIGMTLHTARQTFTRIEFARTREGMGLTFSFSPSF